MLKQPLGVLILHGFTSSRASVAAIATAVETLNLPWRLPCLRGHWTRPEDLAGVTYHDWLTDATTALQELQADCEQVAIVGFSMGALVALDLAIHYPSLVESSVIVAPALRFFSPLAPFSPFLSPFIRRWSIKATGGFSDPSLVPQNQNYAFFPSDAFVALYRAGRYIEPLLPQVKLPLLVIGAKSDRVVRPVCAQLVYDRVSSTEKQLIWFERSGHEMFLDCEAAAVTKCVSEFLCQRLKNYL